jgi:hypothetical protein
VFAEGKSVEEGEPASCGFWNICLSAIDADFPTTVNEKIILTAG